MEINKIYEGNSLDILNNFPDNSINCCVTSPPYYGLRDYGNDNQIGLEETPSNYIDNLVSVFRQINRILKIDGTLWLNIGDSYSSHKDCKSIGQTLAKGTSRENAHVMDLGRSRVRDSKMLKSQGLKNKDLIGIPWMLAFALRADGWYLRQDIIWSKPNPMPESVTDRCTKSHEYIFLLSKSAKYYYDAEAIKEDSVEMNWESRLTRESVKSKPDEKKNGIRKRSTFGNRNGELNGLHSGNDYYPLEKRNKRDVWTVNTMPYSEAHFATFPEKLIVDCIKAGCPEGGIVLDPFMGAGTTGLVARKLNRNYVGIELNPAYIKIAENRIFNEIGLFL